LDEALISLLKQDFPTEQCEIIVVDNKPTGEVYQTVQEIEKKHRHPIRYVQEPKVGLHNARHAGAREARGEILIYIDDDVVTQPNWLSALLDPFSDPQVGCVGGKVIPKWEAEPPEWIEQFPQWHLSLLDYGDERKELAGEVVHGCNMAVRRSVLYEVGGFNPDAMGDRRLIWLRGNGEGGLQEKIYESGYKVIYEPRAWVYHRIPESRLRPEYFFWRAFNNGIGHSYKRIRQCPSRRKMLRHAVRCFLQAIRCYLSSLRHSDNKLKVKADAWYWYGQGQHQLRVTLSRKLYTYVLRDTYL